MASTQPIWYCISAIFVVFIYLSSVSASNGSCPTWFYFSNTTHQCECGAQVQGIECNQKEKKVEILHGTCVTYTGQEGLYYAGCCPFLLKNSSNRMNSELPSNPHLLNNATCGPYKRNSTLCGRCIDGYGLAVFSFNEKCADCSKHSTGHAIILYLSLKLVPLTLFFMCVLFFHLNITAGPLLAYVAFCQLYMFFLQQEMYIYEYIYSHVSEATKILFQSSLTLSDLWSLQYFRFVIPPLCLSTKLTSIHIQLLSLATAIYPIALVVTTCILMELHARNYRIIHILWKPMSILLKKLKITPVTSNAVIHTFATFILLSATSLSFTLFTLCIQIPVYRSTDGAIYKSVLYYDPTITWFSRNHITYIIIGAVVFIFLLLIPSLLLCVYPTRMYGYLSQYISIRKRLAITAFAEALQNCFKDGLNGTRDYRALASLFIIGATVGAIVSSVINVESRYLVPSLIFIWFSFNISYIRPCKLTLANLSLSYHTMVLGILSAANHLWRYDLHTHTTQLKWVFIIPPVLSHILVLTWAGYTLTHRMMLHFGYRTVCKVALTDLEKALKHFFYRRPGGYQVLPDTAI